MPSLECARESACKLGRVRAPGPRGRQRMAALASGITPVMSATLGLLALACTSALPPSAGSKAPSQAQNSTDPAQTPQPEPEPNSAPTPQAEPEPPTGDGPVPTRAQRDAGIPHLRFSVEVGEAPIIGPADAPVTIVMFTDFECPYCHEGQRAMAELRKIYGERLRVAYKAFPMSRHRNALLAALAAESAEAQAKFWPFFERLFGGPRLTRDRLLSVGREVGLDVQRLARDLDELSHATNVMADLRQAKILGVRSTPTFFINGRPISGAMPVHAFREFVDAELALAEQWQSRGVAASELYDFATKRGYTGIQPDNSDAGLDRDMIFPVPLDDSPRRGPDDAALTVVIFGDFECPFCSRGAETLERLRARYGPRMRLVYKHLPLPFHPEGAAAARLSVEAQSVGKFWQLYDQLNAHGPRLDSDVLRVMAMKLGLDPERVEKALHGDLHAEVLERDLDLAAMIGVEGTPAYFVNGRPLGGARPEIDFRMLFAEELERADALLESGVAPHELYDHLTGIAQQ